MISINKCAVPVNTLLANYVQEGIYTDCYTTEIPGKITFPHFIFGFYTTPLFKLERYILNLTVSKPSTDAQARDLANGKIENFAAWRVENRGENELLMCDFLGSTRSWLMIVTVNGSLSRLYFGSAVVLERNSKSLGFALRALLLGFHQMYSVLLLYFAKRRIAKITPAFRLV